MNTAACCLSVVSAMRGFAQVVRNVVFEPRLLPGGGATEMAVSQALTKKAQVALGVNESLRTHGFLRG